MIVVGVAVDADIAAAHAVAIVIITTDSPQKFQIFFIVIATAWGMIELARRRVRGNGHVAVAIIKIKVDVRLRGIVCHNTVCLFSSLIFSGELSERDSNAGWLANSTSKSGRAESNYVPFGFVHLQRDKLVFFKLATWNGKKNDISLPA